MAHFVSNTGWQQSVHFDWYSFTPEVSRDDFLDSALAAFPSAHLEPGRGRLGFVAADHVVLPCGSLLFVVYHNGGSACHVQSSGSTSHSAATWVRGNVPHLLSRADLALDYLDADFDHMRDLFAGAALVDGVKTRFVGPLPGHDPSDLSGRTLYLGSRSSAGMFRVYEKGRQLKDPDRPNWVRVEYEFKPQSIDSRRYFSNCPILELTGTTKISRSVFGMLAVQVPVDVPSVSPLPSDPDFEKTCRHLRRQYHKVFSRVAHDLDFDPVAFIKFFLESPE